TVIPIGVSTLALGLPILDTLFAILRRLRAGRPLYQADKGHLHDRLLALGYTQRQAVILLYVISGSLAAFAIALLYGTLGQAFALFTMAVVTAIFIANRLGLQTGQDE